MIYRKVISICFPWWLQKKQNAVVQTDAIGQLIQSTCTAEILWQQDLYEFIYRTTFVWIFLFKICRAQKFSCQFIEVVDKNIFVRETFPVGWRSWPAALPMKASQFWPGSCIFLVLEQCVRHWKESVPEIAHFREFNFLTTFNEHDMAVLRSCKQEGLRKPAI